MSSAASSVVVSTLLLLQLFLNLRYIEIIWLIGRNHLPRCVYVETKIFLLLFLENPLGVHALVVVTLWEGGRRGGGGVRVSGI